MDREIYLKCGLVPAMGVTGGVTGDWAMEDPDVLLKRSISGLPMPMLNLGRASAAVRLPAPDLRLRRCRSGEMSTSESVWLDSGVEVAAAEAAVGVDVTCEAAGLPPVAERGLDVLCGPETKEQNAFR